MRKHDRVNSVNAPAASINVTVKLVRQAYDPAAQFLDSAVPLV